MLHYETAVVPTKVEIYENMGPGTVNKITVFDAKGAEHVAWKGKDLAKPNAQGVPIALIDLATKAKTNRIKLTIDLDANQDWNEIDAVGLIDSAGNKQWVSWAEASSTYASGEMAAYKYRRVFELLTSPKSLRDE